MELSFTNKDPKTVVWVEGSGTRSYTAFGNIFAVALTGQVHNESLSQPTRCLTSSVHGKSTTELCSKHTMLLV